MGVEADVVAEAGAAAALYAEAKAAGVRRDAFLGHGNADALEGVLGDLDGLLGAGLLALGGEQGHARERVFGPAEAPGAGAEVPGWSKVDIAYLIVVSWRKMRWIWLGTTPKCYDLQQTGGRTMPKFVIERNIPGVGKLTQGELVGVSQKSCGVLKQMGPHVQWVESFVTDDKIYCVYIAPDEASVREHATLGGFETGELGGAGR